MAYKHYHTKQLRDDAEADQRFIQTHAKGTEKQLVVLEANKRHLVAVL